MSCTRRFSKITNYSFKCDFTRNRLPERLKFKRFRICGNERGMEFSIIAPPAFYFIRGVIEVAIIGSDDIGDKNIWRGRGEKGREGITLFTCIQLLTLNGREYTWEQITSSVSDWCRCHEDRSSTKKGCTFAFCKAKTRGCVTTA